MKIYTESSEETLRARKLLKQWAGDGSLSNEQYRHLEQDTVSDLRVTNIFLRLVLLFFTIIVVAAAVGLFFVIFLSRSSQQTTGIFLLIFAAVSYTAAEIAVTRARLYRHGIEEALAVCSVALLSAGVGLFFFTGISSREIQFVVPVVGAMASLWIWYRFNLWYAFPAAMIFAIFPPGYWTSSHSAQLVFIAMLYAAGLIGIAPIRSRHRFDYLADAYSLSEAFLWLGLYLVFNLKISTFSLPAFLGNPTRFTPGPAGPFYWTTWLLIWCLPPLILARGIRLKDRFIIAVGAITAVLTFVTNKPDNSRLAAAYLGPDASRGIALTGVAFFPSTLARSGSGRSSPRLYGRASVGEGQIHDERRLCRTSA